MADAYETLTQKVLTLVEADRTVKWGIADYAREALEDLGIPAQQLASDWGFAATTIRKMVRVAKLFPETQDRNPELSFTHYIIASATTNPRQWIETAADHQWSTRDLREAVNVAKAHDPGEEKTRQAEAAIQRLRRIWQEADADLRAYMTGPLLAFYHAEKLA